MKKIFIIGLISLLLSSICYSHHKNVNILQMTLEQSYINLRLSEECKELISLK